MAENSTEETGIWWRDKCMEVLSQYMSVASALGFDAENMASLKDIHESVLSRATICHQIAMQNGIGGVEHM